MFGFGQHWGWFSLGLALIGLEVLLAPGSFTLWVGLAALVMGGVVLALPLEIFWQIVLFAVLSLVSVLIGWRVYGTLNAAKPSTLLHAPGEALIGRVFTLQEAIVGGHGRIRVDDTVWRVAGEDAAAGQKVRVTGIDGTTLQVAPH